MDTRRTANSRPLSVTSSKDVGSAVSKHPPRQYVAPRRDFASERTGSDAAASYRRPGQPKSRIQRPRARGYDSSCQKEEVAKEKAPAAEYGSAQVWGSKKSNMNHLLNFHFESRDYQDHYSPGCRVGHYGDGRRGVRRAGSSLPYNKERFLQANCQFVVRDGYDYAVHAVDPDTLVEWHRIEQVRIFGHEVSSCPICLYPPKAARITRCGHIYCWSCMLHYLSLDDKSWRKCPICYEAVHEKDLKSVTALETHHYSAGQQITMKLMKKPRGLVQVLPAAAADCADRGLFPPSISDAENTCYAKLLSANADQIQSIIDAERLELQQMLEEEEEASLESSFINAALTSLEARQQHLLTAETGSSKPSDRSSPDVDLPVEIAEHTESEPDDGSIVHTAVPKADLCYASAFDDIEEPVSDTLPYVDTDTSSVDMSAAAPDSDTVSGMTGVASAPALLMLTPDDELPLTEAFSDVSLTDSRPVLVPFADHKSHLDDSFYFYQASDGQHIYMHAVNIRCLVKQYGHLRHCPDTITATVVEMESVSMDEDLRRRLRYLSHLPLTCEFVMAELDLHPPVLSQLVLDAFKDELNKRKVNRQRRVRLEMRHASRIRHRENRQMGFDPTLRVIRSDFVRTSESVAMLPAAVDDTLPSSHTAEDESAISSSVTFGAVAAAGSETGSGQEPSTSPTTLSFAQMLKAGSVKCKSGGEAWPRPVKPASASQSRESQHNSDADDYQQVPRYESSLSDAIQAALDSYDHTTDVVSAEVQAPAGGKKKQKKKKLLFSTSLPRGS